MVCVPVVAERMRSRVHSGRSCKNPFSELHRIFNAHTSVAEITPGPIEQRLRRRSMHIDVVLVREQELDQPERVLRSWALAHTQHASRRSSESRPTRLLPERCPRHRARPPCPCVAGSPDQVGASARISRRRMDRGTFQYGRKVTSFIVSNEHGRLGVECAADDDVHPKQRHAGRRNRVPRPQAEHRDVQGDEAGIAQVRQTSAIVRAPLDLPDPPRHRNAQRGESTSSPERRRVRGRGELGSV